MKRMFTYEFGEWRNDRLWWKTVCLFKRKNDEYLSDNIEEILEN